MSMRIFSAAALLVLAAGTQGANGAASDPGNLIECALAGAADFARDCAIERQREGGGLFLTDRRPDGGFQRFEVLPDGRGLASADGTEPVQVSLRENGIHVAVGADRSASRPR